MLKAKNQGLTLLELLLVIAVATSLVVGSLSFLRIKAEHAKSDKTIYEAQQWLQAAISYSASGNTLPTGKNLTQFLVAAGYMPSIGQHNPWSQSYELIFDGSMLHLTTQVPSEAAAIVAGNLPLAQTISTDAQQDGNFKKISMQAPMPEFSDPYTIQYVDIVAGTRDDPYLDTPVPFCPNNQQPEIFVAPVAFASGRNAYPVVQVGAYAEAIKEGEIIRKWRVYSSLYTTAGAADKQMDSNTFKEYNKVLVMTKCPKAKDQEQLSAANNLAVF